MNSSNYAIIADGVGKKFRLRSAGVRTLKSACLDILKLRARTARDFWALRDVSFKVARGETLGIIGANGAGKSILLSLLAGTKTPTVGSIRVSGVVSSLLELGAGFHPDLTGRENVFLCGAIMGLSQKQIRKRFDAIVDFAEIKDFIDEPVKHYSSGMYVRLGFAVAVEVDPDILLIDEVLAVGDINFQRKCIDKMRDFKMRGKTMLIISHDLATIQTISDRILMLDEGRIMEIGAPGSVVSQYEALCRKKFMDGIRKEWGTGAAKITAVKFLNEDGEQVEKFKWKGRLAVRIFYKAECRIADPVFGFALSTVDGRLIYGNNTQIEQLVIPAIEGAGAVTLRIEEIAMAAGTYLFSFSLHSADHKTNYHRLDNMFPIVIESGKNFEGCCYMPCKWTMEKP